MRFICSLYFKKLILRPKNSLSDCLCTTSDALYEKLNDTETVSHACKCIK